MAVLDELRPRVADLERSRALLIRVALDTDVWDGLLLANLDRSVDRAIEELVAALAREAPMGE